MISNLANQPVAETCRELGLPENVQAHLHGDPTPEQFMRRLMKAKLYADAAAFLAHVLPEHDAVRWAGLSVRSVPTCCGDAKSTSMLEAAEAWVHSPDEEARIGAQSAAAEHDFEMPGAAAAWVAMAAAWSGESARAKGPPPPEHLTSQAVSRAVLLATAASESKRKNKVLRQFLELGLRIAAGEEVTGERRN